MYIKKCLNTTSESLYSCLQLLEDAEISLEERKEHANYLEKEWNREDLSDLNLKVTHLSLRLEVYFQIAQWS